MTLSRTARTLALLGCVALAFHPAPTPAQETDRPLVLEDVVRLYVSGTPAGELIDRIHRSQVDFDISDEMLEELSRAGLPDDLIQAMVDRQAELHPPAAPPPDETPAVPDETGPTGLTVHLKITGAKTDKGDDDETPAQSLRVIDAVHPEVLEQLRVRDPEARITDIAVYVACLSATHVPDHWRSHTPLGRDFITAQRHKMLLFHTGSTTEPEPEGASVLRLALPTDLLVELDAEDEHDIAVGLAVEIGGRYYHASAELWEDLVPANEAGEIQVDLHQPEDLSPWSMKLTKSNEPAGQPS